MKKRFNNDYDDEEEEKAPSWPAIRDLFKQLISPAKDWPESDCLGTISDMAKHFSQAYPEVMFTVEDLRLALYDMGIPYERNENNNKHYYLAKWL